MNIGCTRWRPYKEIFPFSFYISFHLCSSKLYNRAVKPFEFYDTFLTCCKKTVYVKISLCIWWAEERTWDTQKNLGRKFIKKRMHKVLNIPKHNNPEWERAYKWILWGNTSCTNEREWKQQLIERQVQITKHHFFFWHY